MATGAEPQVPKARVLVVDDNPVNRTHAQLILEKAGYAVDAIGNGREAVEMVQALAYDAVLMDCEMPVMDGYRAASEIRRQERPSSRIPIVAVTASETKEDVDRAFAAGMDAHIAKPIDRDELLTALSRLFGVPTRRQSSGDSAPAALNDSALAQLRTLDESGETLRALATTFLRIAAERCQQLADAVVVGDSQTARLAAHTLKGAAGMFGLEIVVAVADRIYDETRNGDEPSDAIVEELRSAVAEAMTVLLRTLADGPADGSRT